MEFGTSRLDSGNGLEEEWQNAPLTDSIPMAVPSSFNDLGVTADIRDHVGWVWYEREFIIPNSLTNERVVLRFGSATHLAKVFVNGKFVIEHKGGFLPFEAELNQYLIDRKKSFNRCN